MANQARKRRGRESEHIATVRLKQKWEAAHVVNSGASGSDVLGLPFDVEVKARAGFNPKAAMDQLKNRNNGRLGFAVMRLNGQGEAQVDDWCAVIRFGDLIELLSRYYPNGDYHSIDHCKKCGDWAIVGRECRTCSILESRFRQL